MSFASFGMKFYFTLLIHRSDPKLYLYGGERMEITEILSELIEVLVSLWKVRYCVLVLRRPSLNRF